MLINPTPTPKNRKKATRMPDRQTTRIAQERIRILFQQAEQTFPEDPDLAQRYVDLARRIAMRTRTHLPRDLRRRICRNCKAYLVPGATSRTRIRQRREPHVATTCLKCGHTTRIPLKEKET
jgi:ribonuclease P protein subunit RPR2